MKAETLQKAMLGYVSLDRANELIDGCNRAIELANLNTVNRVAMFLAQLGEESGSLKYTEEIASGSEYEGRSDLGNTQSGDGVRFKGRSFIQITGRTNYTAFSRWAHEKGIVSYDGYFIDHPEQLSNNEFAWMGPVWYWTVARPQLNSLADAGDIYGATRAINGGLNGIDDRIRRWNACRALGSALTEEVDELNDTDLAKIEALIVKHRKGLFDDLRITIRNAFGAFITHKPKGWFTHATFPAAVPPSINEKKR